MPAARRTASHDATTRSGPATAARARTTTCEGNAALPFAVQATAAVKAAAALTAGLVLAASLIPSPADAGTRGKKRQHVREIIVHATGGPSCRRGRVHFSAPGTLDHRAICRDHHR
ncbi:MAG: hypothetical protein AAFR04_04375 [Pseudomonadota bacterium]